MKKKGICISCFIFAVVLISLKIYSDTEHQEENLDSWIGEYRYTERGDSENGSDGEIYHQITVWEQDRKYYAIIQDKNWISGPPWKKSWSFASVSGDRNKISFIFLQTLAWDDLYGIRQRYAKGEVLLQFERRGDEIVTEWGALRDQSFSLAQTEEVISGSYFEKEEYYRGE